MLGHIRVIQGYIAPIKENQMDKKMEQEVKTAMNKWLIGDLLLGGSPELASPLSSGHYGDCTGGLMGIVGGLTQ